MLNKLSEYTRCRNKYTLNKTLPTELIDETLKQPFRCYNIKHTLKPKSTVHNNIISILGILFKTRIFIVEHHRDWCNFTSCLLAHCCLNFPSCLNVAF